MFTRLRPIRLNAPNTWEKSMPDLFDIQICLMMKVWSTLMHIQQIFMAQLNFAMCFPCSVPPETITALQALYDSLEDHTDDKKTLFKIIKLMKRVRKLYDPLDDHTDVKKILFKIPKRLKRVRKLLSVKIRHSNFCEKFGWKSTSTHVTRSFHSSKIWF